MAMKILGTAAIALACSMGICAAQSPDSAPDEARALLAQVAQARGFDKLAPGAAPVQATGGVARSGGPPIVLGFNFFHATNCGWFFDGANQWYYVFTGENGTLWFEINNVSNGLGLQTACVNGHLMAVNVTNTSTGAYNQTYSYPSVTFPPFWN